MPIFITARFRTGSTLLWRIFRTLDSITAYYEPFNERRWFDPRSRGDRVDASHRGVSDYWVEYDKLSEVAAFYDEQWTRRRLYMGAADWDPGMEGFIRRLIAAAPGRPVLQFNRVDFRLPWLRSTFPCARIVHLYRDPRDQWCSTLDKVRPFPREGTMREFRDYDGFYLGIWAEDLKYQFPFLDPETDAHPYRLFYLIWRLSYAFGRAYGDVSISYESLIEHPHDVLGTLFAKLSIAVDDMAAFSTIVESRGTSQWRRYADDAWFVAHESECERLLRRFFDCAVHEDGEEGRVIG